MASPLTCDHFIELCRKSAVVETEQLDSFLRTHQLPDDPRQVAALLIHEGLLTRFQAAQLLHGKHRGFIINGLKILEQLGVGGMGAVYLCEQLMLRRKVAVKVLPTKQAQDRVARERFFREARAVAALDHPNIIRIHDCASTNEIHYLLMEYVEGIDLQDKLDREGALSVDDAIGYVIQTASGLMHAHERGLVHRDVKPSNLLLDLQGTIKILDMGLARFFRDEQDNLTKQLDGGAVVGTVDFLAPEQAIESSKVDARADIYSLGATLYTLMSGKPPFGGSTTQKLINHQVKTPPPLNEIRPDVPMELNAIVEKMMAKNPDDRYQSSQEVIDALAAWSPSPTQRSKVTTVSAPRSTILPRSMSDFNPRSSNVVATQTDPVVKKHIPRPWLIGGGIVGLVALVILILILSGKKDLDNSIAVIPNPKQPVDTDSPNPKAATKIEPLSVKKAGAVVKLPPAEERTLVELDWKEFAPWTARFQGSNQLETRGSGQLPKDWKTSSWDKNSIVETSLEKLDGQPAIVQRNIEGKASNMLFTPTILFQPKARYELFVEYRTQNAGSGGIVLFDEQQKTRTVLDLPPTKGGWRIQRLSLEGFLSEIAGRFELHLSTMGAENSIAYRRVQIRESLVSTRDAEPSHYKIDFSQTPVFSLRYQQGKVISSTGSAKWPHGWYGACWRAGSEGEGALEQLGATPLLALRNVAGDPSIQLASDRMFQNLQPGKAYRLRVTYLTEAKCSAEFQIRIKEPNTPGAYYPGVSLRNTNGLIRTIEEEFSPLPNRDYQLFIQNVSKGEKSSLFLKSIEVVEAVPVAGSTVAKFDFASLQPFKFTLNEREELYRDGLGTLPAGWKTLALNAKSVGSVAVEKISDRNVLGLELLEGDPSVSIQSSTPLGTLRAGHLYELRVSYSASENRRACVGVLNESSGPIERLFLLPTDGQWRESSLRFQARVDEPFHLLISNQGKAQEGKVLFRSLELVDVTK